ncbi:MAG: efflux RND transporter permease subunit [Campylobacterales bacterium]|nr:efflux RND transporter permease subunit [Campylobacterales bacterium]
MNLIIEFFIGRPRLNYLLFFFLILAGVVSYVTMPKEIFPPLALDKISITGFYSGASPNALDKMAVSRIEDEISNVSGIRSVESTIASGRFSMVVELEKSADKNDVLQKIKDGIARVRPDLPADMDEPNATLFAFSIPLILVNISSDTLSIDALVEIAKAFKSDLSQIENLTNLQIYGEGERVIEIVLDTRKLEAYGLSSASMATAIGRISSIFPIGKLEETGGKHAFISTYNGKEPHELLNALLRIDGKSLRLGDVATIEKHYTQTDTLSSFEGRRSLSVNVAKTEEGNAMALASKVKERVNELAMRYPGVTVGTFSDTSVYIENRLNTVVSNILFGLILVGLVMHLLVNHRISLVVIIGVPTSFIIALLFMDLGGYSINMMTLLGALIAIGVIVDDAIIVAENIQRHIEEGMAPKEAAIVGTKEVVTPVLAASFTTIFAFLPMLIMSGEMGQFIKLIPIAISVLILASLIESFIFLPIHASHLLRPKDKQVDWSRAMDVYINFVRKLIKYRKTTLFTFWILVPALIVGGFALSKFKIFPEFDGDQMNISCKLPVETTLEETHGIARALEAEVLRLKEKYFIENVTVISGFRMNAKGEGEEGTNLFHLFVDLKRAKPDNLVSKYITPILSFDLKSMDYERTFKSYDIEAQLRDELVAFMAQYETVNFEVQGPNAGVVSMPIELFVYAAQDEDAKVAIARIKRALGGIKGTNTIGDDATLGVPEIKLKVTPYGEILGIDEGTLARVLGEYFLESSQAKGFDDEGFFDVILKEKNHNSLERLRSFMLTLDSGKQVALRDVVEFVEVENYEKIFKKDGKKRWMVFSNVASDITPSEVLKELKPTLDAIASEGVVNVGFGGEKEQNDQLVREMSMASAIALFLIFVTLLVMFDSYRLAFIILSVVPFSLLGVVAGHSIMGMDLSMPSMIGALGLAGVVINDGIIMLDFIRKTTTMEALLGRAKLRLRPIVLTSITTLAGLSTLIFFPSGQAVILQPLAVSLGFGLLWGTFLNLVYLPTLYAFVSKVK